jgi:hypothetical protein
MRRQGLVYLLMTLATTTAVNAQTATTPASTQSASQPGLLRRMLWVKNEGWGGSAVTDMSAFYFNGDYNVLSAGLGFGVSDKFELGARRQYPNEIGLYLAPLFTGADNKNAASVSAMAHWLFKDAFGIGFGFRFWENGTGVVGPNKNRAFFTLGYGLTNKKEQ